MRTYVEHTQKHVSDLARTRSFYLALFPEWSMRAHGRELLGGRPYEWLHIGDDQTYVAFRGDYKGADSPGHPLQELNRAAKAAEKPGHIGIVVADVEEKVRLLKAMGAQVITTTPHPFRLRVYTLDPDGYEIELVQYLTADPAERHDYSWCIAHGESEALA